MNNTMAKLFDFNFSTYYRWRKEQRPIILFLEKYFEKKDLEEYLQTGKILWLESAHVSIYISQSNFIDKLKILYDNEDSYAGLFYSFIAHYISSNWWDDNKDDYVWIGVHEISMFQNEFYQYLIDSNVAANYFRHITSFINQLTVGDLLFINLNIQNGFELLPDSSIDTYSLKSKTDVVSEMRSGLKYTLQEKANIKGTIKELIDKIIQNSIEKCIENDKKRL